MDKLAEAIFPPSRVDLAREADFRLGALRIRPSRREVEGGGVRHVLQRRVMQVLVALATSTSEVVSQQELIQRCWGGLSVSDDAIGRCIAQLRRLAATWAEPPFDIETIAGVGYQLRPSEPLPGRAAERRPARRAPPVVRPFAIAAAVACLVVAAGAWAALSWLGRPAALATPVVQVRAFELIGSDPALRPLAARAADSIAAFLGDSDVRVVSGPPATGGPTAPLAFGGAMSSAADGQVRLHLFYEDTRSGTTLWSRDYVRPPAEADALIDEAEGGAMEVVNLTRPSYGPSGLLLDPETLLLGVRAGEEGVIPTYANENDAVHQFEMALARAPNSAILHGGYATALVQAAFSAPPADRPMLLAHARAEAERTIHDYRSPTGLAYWTLLVMDQAAAPRDWKGAPARMDAALKAAPEEPFLWGYECNFLLNVGRARDSFYSCQRALSLRPHTAPLLLEYAQAVDMAGDHPQIADQLLDEGARLYPDHESLKIYRFARQAFAGSPDKALALLHDPASAPPISPDAFAAVEALEKARKTGLPADADAAMASMRHADAHDPISDFRFLFPMTLGRMDEAFAEPDISVVVENERELLTFPFTARLRADRRFWPLAARAGLVRYWLATDKWPDFCSDPTYPLDCRAEARRAASALKS